MMRRFLPLALLALAACSQSDESEAPEPAATAESTTAAVETPTPAAIETATPSHLALAPLASNDGQVITASMQNVGGCSFTDESGRRLMMVGTPDSNTAPGIGVARPGGRQAKLITEYRFKPYDDDAVTLTFEGIEVTLDRDASEGEPVGIETVQWPAELTVSDADGNSRSYSGDWACGV